MLALLLAVGSAPATSQLMPPDARSRVRFRSPELTPEPKWHSKRLLGFNRPAWASQPDSDVVPLVSRFWWFTNMVFEAPVRVAIVSTIVWSACFSAAPFAISRLHPSQITMPLAVWPLTFQYWPLNALDWRAKWRPDTLEGVSHKKTRRALQIGAGLAFMISSFAFLARRSTCSLLARELLPPKLPPWLPLLLWLPPALAWILHVKSLVSL